jgi:hypothetical protein
MNVSVGMLQTPAPTFPAGGMMTIEFSIGLRDETILN